MTVTAALENPFAGQGSVLLDIGGDVGALVVTMPAAMEGVEVEIRPHSHDRDGGDHDKAHEGHDHTHDGRHDHGGGRHQHVAVVSRPVLGTQVPSLVFPELVEGSYDLYEKNTTDVRLVVSIIGGEVTTAAWPTS